MSDDIIGVCIGVAFALCFASYMAGYRVGFKKGEAEAWLDHYFAGVARNRARRQRNGQFKPKSDLSA